MLQFMGSQRARHDLVVKNKNSKSRLGSARIQPLDMKDKLLRSTCQILSSFLASPNDLLPFLNLTFLTCKMGAATPS